MFRTKKKQRSVKLELLAMTIIPLSLIAIIITEFSIKSMTTALEQEALSNLQATATAVNAGYTSLNDEPYMINENGEMMKGDFNITRNETVMDSYTQGTETDITIFYEDTRMATSLIDHNTHERIIGTKVSDIVRQTVYDRGEIYTTKDIMINDENYFCYYMPLKNPDNTIAGIIFAGKPSTDIHAYIAGKRRVIITLAGFCCLLGILICFYVSGRIAKAITCTKAAVDRLANGDLTITVNPSVLKRKDELGLMGKSVETLIKELHEIVNNIQHAAENVLQSGNTLEHTADQTNQTAGEINSAIDNISKGAVFQAENIETTTNKILEMGTAIEQIAANIEQLDQTSMLMKNAENESTAIMQELSLSNDKTTEAIEKVSVNITATDESVKNIAEAIALITGIANQTNLLSLNASIEAAHAGDAGKGFAVVASEIKKLSEESSQSAQKITEIIKTLSADSKNSMTVMTEVRDRLADQQNKLNATKDKFLQVSNGILSFRENTITINEQAKSCDAAREHVVDTIQNLSAISQENAASTEETTASMEELSANIALLADSSETLKELAETLNEKTKFFHI